MLTLSSIVILGNTLTQDNTTRKQTTSLLTDLTTCIDSATASHNTDTGSMSYLAAQRWTLNTFPAIYQARNTSTKPCRLQVSHSQPLLAPQVLASRCPSNHRLLLVGLGNQTSLHRLYILGALHAQAANLRTTMPLRKGVPWQTCI
jgi:hypothetical protein